MSCGPAAVLGTSRWCTRAASARFAPGFALGFAVGFALGFALVMSGCAGRMPPPKVLAPGFAGDDAARASRLAPDLYARAERARTDADAATDGAVAADHAERAQLLLAAAIAEADRIELDRERAAVEARHGGVEEERAALERTRVEVVHEIRLLEAGRIARTEAARVFEQAEVDESGRPDRKQRAQAHGDAAGFFLERAELTLAAAVAMGVDERSRKAARQAIDGASKQRNPSSKAVAAERALARAERALGEARRARGGPRPTEVASLLEAGRERGLSIELLERGVAVSLEGYFRAGSAQLTPAGERQLVQLEALLGAHPHGPVQLESLEPAGARGASKGLFNARAARIRKALDPAAPGRVELVATAGGRAQVVLVAYALGAAQ